MENTEVTLGVDNSKTVTQTPSVPSPTVVDLKPAEKYNKSKIIATVVGGGVGFAYAKYKKFDTKKTVIVTGLGMVLGFLAEKIYTKNKKVIVNPSK